MADLALGLSSVKRVSRLAWAIALVPVSLPLASEFIESRGVSPSPTRPSQGTARVAFVNVAWALPGDGDCHVIRAPPFTTMTWVGGRRSA